MAHIENKYIPIKKNISRKNTCFIEFEEFIRKTA